ncbi:putative ribonuclease H protein [Vitis vinifera]|uniref:Putative ribonuclease H protein n=1 Tax=Vitis vinifera TaxID=29760 RepID=A0A438KCL4_VITVI|nr:putative ribonuclease H protein [Vitis vinifera]
MQVMSKRVVRSLGPGRFLDWRALNAMGSAGGVLICWDKRSLEILDWEEGQFSISCRFRNVGDGVVWVFTGVYGPFSREERECLWEENGAIRGLWEERWEVLGSLERNKVEALQQVELWDLVEGERSLTDEELSRQKKAKEGYAKRVNFLNKIKINGVRLSKEQEVREGIANAYQQLLSDSFGWKADIGALMRMNGDKALDPDRFTVAFWQNCWETVKKEVLDMFKEFHEQNSFIKSLNNTFLVFLSKKGGAEDLGDYRPISLLGGLYKLLAKVLANRLKKVIGKVVSPNQNAFIKGRQILDASLIANEVMQKMGFGAKVAGMDVELHIYCQILSVGERCANWIFLKFEGVASRGPSIPLLVRHGNGSAKCAYHEGLVFCEARKEYLTHLSWILFCFEAASGLKINLDKSEVIPVGEVEEVNKMAVEIGCRVGQLSAVYLGLPLGTPNKATSVWDEVKEKSTLASIPLYQMSLFCMPKSVARRLEKLQRDFLWGGANGEKKTHLVKWEVVCADKEKGGLGLRKLACLNKALLGKWIWRFARVKEDLWKKVLEAKYGQEEFGWRTRKANGVFGVGV